MWGGYSSRICETNQHRKSVAFSHFCLGRRLCGFVYGHRSISIAGPSGKQIKDTNRLIGESCSTTRNHGTTPYSNALVGPSSFVFVDSHRLFLFGRHHGSKSCSSRSNYHFVMAYLRHFFCRPNCIQLARDSCSSMGLGSFFFAGFRVCGK